MSSVSIQSKERIDRPGGEEERSELVSVRGRRKKKAIFMDFFLFFDRFETWLPRVRYVKGLV